MASGVFPTVPQSKHVHSFYNVDTSAMFTKQYSRQVLVHSQVNNKRIIVVLEDAAQYNIYFEVYSP